MNYAVSLHPDAIKYLDSLNEKERKRCFDSLKNLEENPFVSRSGCDIKKLVGKKNSAYRLRVGENRFIYLVKNKDVMVEEGFKRGKGY